MDSLLYVIIGGFIFVVAIASVWGRISLRNQLERTAKSQVLPLSVKPRTSITIERDGGLLWLRPFKIYINRRYVGDISPQEVRSFAVSPGSHTIDVRLDWLRSKVVQTDVLENQASRIQCGIKSLFYRPNAPVWTSLLFRHRNVIYLDQIQSCTPVNAHDIPRLVPLTLGFASLGGDDLLPLLNEDVAALSPLFKNINLAPVTQLPSCEILFLYAHLRKDGALIGVKSPAGLRQLAQLTGAKIIVLASPNNSDAIQSSISLAGPKQANLIFTLDRNGSGFSKLFCELFEKMQSGESMLHAWVQLIPQCPSAMPANVPATIFLAEAGDLSFPKPT